MDILHGVVSLSLYYLSHLSSPALHRGFKEVEDWVLETMHSLGWEEEGERHPEAKEKCFLIAETEGPEEPIL